VSVARFVADQRTMYRVPHTVTCAILGIGISWFYKWFGRGPLNRAMLDRCPERAWCPPASLTVQRGWANTATYIEPELAVPASVIVQSSMLALWPGLFIHPLTAACADVFCA
jgi:hypothetical protein